MRVIGTGHAHVYECDDEHPHRPDSDALWQESFAVIVWDTSEATYILLRLGQEPNRGPGYTTVWLNVWVNGYQYKLTDDSIVMSPGDATKSSLSASGGLCRYEYDGNFNWTVDDKLGDVHLQLVMKDSHPGFGYYPENAGAAISQTSKHHIEATGTATGTVTIEGRAYEFRGPAWRDHSWGKRSWTSILTHRCYPAIFGPDFSFFALTMVGIDGAFIKLGTIIRNDSVEGTTDFDIVAFMSEDGVSNCGGEVTLRTKGQSYILRFEPLVKGVVSFHQGFACVDRVCKITMGGRTGVGFSETSHRAQGGTDRPHVYANSDCIIENGLHRLK